jgi:hypothetical protein
MGVVIEICENTPGSNLNERYWYVIPYALCMSAPVIRGGPPGGVGSEAN